MDRIVTAKSVGSLREATIIGDGAKTSINSAFLVNSYLSHLGDACQNHLPFPNHPGRYVINAVLAAGERLDARIGDVTIATLLTYELIMQACRTARGVIWPEYRDYPDPKFVPYLSLPFFASMARQLLESRSNENLSLITSLVLETLSILQSNVGRRGINSGEEDVFLIRFSESLNQLEYTKNTWNQCLTKTVGLGTTSSEHFLLGCALSLGRAVRPRPPLPHRITDMVLMGPVGFEYMIEDENDVAKLRIATAAAFYLFGARLSQSWHLTARLNRPQISRIAERVKFTDDLKYLFESDDPEGFLFTAHIHVSYGGMQTGRILYPVMAFRDLVRRSNRSWFKAYTVYFIGEKRCTGLCEGLMNSNSMPVAELLKLTYPQAWPRHILEKVGLVKGS